MLWRSHVTATVVACDLPCTSASVIFRTSSHSDFTLCFFDLSIKILALLLWTTLTIGLSPLGRTPIFSLSSRINVFACCWHCSVACCWHCSFFTDSWVPTLAVFLCPSRPSDPRSSAHLVADSCTVPLSPVAGCDRATVSRSKHALQTSSFVPIVGFGSRVSLALVCFFSPDCDFLFVIVLVA